MATINITEKAAEKVHELISKQGLPETAGLRLGVQGGGCSGLSYALKFDTEARTNDKVFELNGVKVFVDPKSFIYLAGTTLDYQESLVSAGFVFQNPNAAKSCGCGASFSA